MIDEGFVNIGPYEGLNYQTLVGLAQLLHPHLELSLIHI